MCDDQLTSLPKCCENRNKGCSVSLQHAFCLTWWYRKTSWSVCSQWCQTWFSAAMTLGVGDSFPKLPSLCSSSRERLSHLTLAPTSSSLCEIFWVLFNLVNFLCCRVLPVCVSNKLCLLHCIMQTSKNFFLFLPWASGFRIGLLPPPSPDNT